MLCICSVEWSRNPVEAEACIIRKVDVSVQNCVDYEEVDSCQKCPKVLTFACERGTCSGTQYYLSLTEAIRRGPSLDCCSDRSDYRDSVMALNQS